MKFLLTLKTIYVRIPLVQMEIVQLIDFWGGDAS